MRWGKSRTSLTGGGLHEAGAADWTQRVLSAALIMMVAFAAVSCTSRSDVDLPAPPAEGPEAVGAPTSESETAPVTAPEPEAPEALPSEDSKAWTERWLVSRPVFVMLDNHSGARPQSGLPTTTLTKTPTRLPFRAPPR